MTHDNGIELQNYLLSQGNRWLAEFVGERVYSGGQWFVNINDHGIMTHGTTAGYKIRKLVKTVSYSLEEVREKICIGEKSYYIDELTKALENIKPI
jgi:hypothetical protein